MTIAIGWYNPEQTIIHLELKRGWKWDQLKKAIAEADTMIISVEHTVHVLIDIRQAGGVPTDFLSAAGEIFASGDARPNEGKKVVVGAGLLVRTAYNGLVSVYGHKLAKRPFLFAANIQEARTLLNKR